jgi:hypothetical protein
MRHVSITPCLYFPSFSLSVGSVSSRPRRSAATGTTAKEFGGRRDNAQWEGPYVRVTEANDVVVQEDMSCNDSLDSVSEAGCVSEREPGTDAIASQYFCCLPQWLPLSQ